MRLAVYFKNKTLGVKTYDDVSALEVTGGLLVFMSKGWKINIPVENLDVWEEETAIKYVLGPGQVGKEVKRG